MKYAKVKKFENVCEIINKHDRDASKLISILQDIQEEYRYLPKEIMTFTATMLGIAPARVFGVATFYSHFALEPKGKYVIKVCDGTACHVKKSTDLITAVQKKLGLTNENNTTTDMMFTLEAVSCLGACGLAPAMVINDEVHGLLTAEKAVGIIQGIIESEKGGHNE
jgi:NADH-quinone oxidoreductase subunit E